MVQNTKIKATIADKEAERLEKEHKNMYEQKINEQISRQLKGQFVVKNDTNWMRSHNYNSCEALKN